MVRLVPVADAAASYVTTGKARGRPMLLGKVAAHRGEKHVFVLTSTVHAKGAHEQHTSRQPELSEDNELWHFFSSELDPYAPSQPVSFQTDQGFSHGVVQFDVEVEYASKFQVRWGRGRLSLLKRVLCPPIPCTPLRFDALHSQTETESKEGCFCAPLTVPRSPHFAARACLWTERRRSPWQEQL